MLQQIFEKNNLGVEHLCNCRYMDAKKTLKSALLNLLVLIQKQQNEQAPAKKSVSRQETSSFQVHTCSVPESSNAHSPSHTFYMFRHAFLLTATALNDAPRLNETDIAFFTAIFTYNLGLASHIQCDMECYESTANSNPSNRILKFYQKALKAIQEMGNEVHAKRLSSLSSLSEYRTTMTIGVFMNMGAVLFEEGNLEKAEHCFNLALMKQDDIEQFLLERIHTNLFLLQERLAEVRSIEALKEQQRKLKLKAWEEEYYEQVKKRSDEERRKNKSKSSFQNFVASRSA